MLKRGGHSFALVGFFSEVCSVIVRFFAWFFLFFVGICLLPVVLICSPFILLLWLWYLGKDSKDFAVRFFAWVCFIFTFLFLWPVICALFPFILLFCVWKISRNSTGAVEILKQNSDGKVFKESKGFFGKLENELEKLGNKLIELSGKLKKSKSDDEVKPKKPKRTNKSKSNERKKQ